MQALGLTPSGEQMLISPAQFRHMDAAQAGVDAGSLGISLLA